MGALNVLNVVYMIDMSASEVTTQGAIQIRILLLLLLVVAVVDVPPVNQLSCPALPCSLADWYHQCRTDIISCVNALSALRMYRAVRCGAWETTMQQVLNSLQPPHVCSFVMRNVTVITG